DRLPSRLLNRLSSLCFRTRRASSETTNHSLRSVRWLHSGSHHLGKQVNIIVRFARHVFPDRVQHLQELWSSIHQRFTISAQLTFSVASETKNSGVTIIGT